MPLDLTPYLPTQAEVTSSHVAEVLSRLRIQSLSLFPDVKTTTNSVFGNLILEPLATLLATYEIAAERVRSDMILSNIAQGIIYDCNFVTEYLKNYGVSADSGVPVIGTVRLKFDTNKKFIIDRGTHILFGSVGLFHIIAPEIGDVIVDMVGSSKTSNNWYALTKTGDNEYAVNLPVIGPAGVTVAKDSIAFTDLDIPELISIEAVRDFESGRMPTTLPELAVMAQAISYAANFADRGGAIGFLKRKLPNLVGVSPIKSGDDEMQRDKDSILGVNTGKMDVLVKGATTYVTDSVIISLAEYSSNDYRTALTLPGGIPNMIESVTDIDGNPVDNFYIYGTSSDNNRARYASAAFSDLEILGLRVTTQSLLAQDSSYQIIKNNSNYPKLDIANSGGIYKGHIFSNKLERKIKLVATGTKVINGVTKGVFYAEDMLSGEILEELFITESNSRGVIDFEASGIKAYHMFNGIDLYFETSSNSFNVSTTDTFQNAEIILYFRAKTANVLVTYRYDPSVQIVNTLLKSGDIQPVIDVLPKAFNTAYIDNLTINYKRGSAIVKKEQIKDELLEYFNSLVYDNTYDYTTINDIVLYGNAKGLDSMDITATVYHSLAEKWSLDGLDVIDDFVELPTKNLINFNATYDEALLYNIVGPRNINYILDRNKITLREVS